MIAQSWLPKHHDKLSPIPNGLLAQKYLPPVRKRLFQKAPPTPSNTQVYKQLFAPVTTQENIVDDQVLTLPIAIDTLGLYANTASLQAAGIQQLPTTWSDLVTVVTSLAKHTALTITQPGIGMGTSNNVGRAAEILATLMMQQHTPMLNAAKDDAPLNETITKATGEPFQPGVTALDFYTSFASPTKENFSWSASQPEDFELFANGGLPFLIDYSFRVRDLEQKSPTLQFSTAPLPQIVKDGSQPSLTLATPLVVGVPSVSKQQAAAWDFVTFLANRDNSLAYARASGRPAARLDIAANQGFDPRLAPFFSQIPYATMWYQRDITKTTIVFKQAIDAVLGGQPLVDVVDRLSKQTTHILRDEPYE